MSFLMMTVSCMARNSSAGSFITRPSGAVTSVRSGMPCHWAKIVDTSGLNSAGIRTANV